MQRRKTLKDIYFVLHALASENRHVLSTWRAHVLLRRGRDAFYPFDKVEKAVRKLDREELIEPIQGKTLYKVTCPYARPSLNIYELANEAYPAGILSHSSAMELHRLTDQRSYTMHLYEAPYTPGQTARVPSSVNEKSSEESLSTIPPGTNLADWRTESLPRNVRLTDHNEYIIQTHTTKAIWIFGSEILQSQGVDIRVTNVERTLIDGLRNPANCGGLNEVFRAWVRAADDLSVDQLVEYVKRFDQSILYQRVGFVLEAMGIHHEQLDSWKKEKAQRGGSRVLNADKDYAPEYSEDWKLSINHPVHILEQRDASYS